MHGRKKTILMFPWPGHGHVSPFLELAQNLLINTNLLDVYLCSTPENFNLIKKVTRTKYGSPVLRFIKINFPTLPEPMHTTNGLPSDRTLKQAFDMVYPQFSPILKSLKPDLLIYDIIQPWAALAASTCGIPSVVFINTSVAATLFHFHLNNSGGNEFPFSKTIYYRRYEYARVRESDINKDNKDLVTHSINCSSSIVLVKSFKEIEAKYIDHLSVLLDKKIVPVGPLVGNPLPIEDVKQKSVMQWLDQKASGSTVFVSFGTQYFLSNHDLEEIAYGLEMSDVNFIWVLMLERKISISEALPLGFLERVKDKGLVTEEWALQGKILGHKNIGGFVSHCGWSSTMEGMKYGVPIIAMPMQLDQPINARLVEELGIGVEVVRDENGRLSREKMAAVVRHVVVSKFGVAVRDKAKKTSVDLSVEGEKEINAVIVELLQLCRHTGN